MKVNYCTKLKSLLEEEKEIINKHIDYHKWCNKISDKNEAIMDFIKKYIWIIKEMYCFNVCKEDCKLRDMM